MPYDKKKYTRISVDLLPEEYRELHRFTEAYGCSKASFVRRAIREKLTERFVEERKGRAFSRVK